VNLGIEALRCVELRGGRYQPNAVRRIDRRLPLREHDQGAAVLVKFRAHAGGRFATPVSVSRMCAWSRMPLASSVAKIECAGDKISCQAYLGSNPASTLINYCDAGHMIGNRK
jgi:hypothetical protein